MNILKEWIVSTPEFTFSEIYDEETALQIFGEQETAEIWLNQGYEETCILSKFEGLLIIEEKINL